VTSLLTPAAATLDALFRARAEEHAGRPFVLEPIPGGGFAVSTFAAVLAEAERVQGFLEARGERERAGLLLPNGKALLVSFFGALLAGWTAVPIDPRLRPAEIQFILAHARCRVLVGGAFTKELLAGIPASCIAAGYDAVIRDSAPPPRGRARIAPADPAVILATSGSTAAPKAVVLTHRNVRQDQRRFQERYGFTAGDVFLSTLSLYHSFGMTACLLTALDAGAALAIVDEPQPVRVASLAARHLPTAFFAVASFYQYLVRGSAERADFAAVRCFLSGATALPDATAKRFREKFGRDIVQTYGLTEASPVVTANPLSDNRVGTVGTALAGVELEVGSDGELWVRGETVMQGYLDNAAATAACVDESGWLKTGDLARIDADGYVTILGRKKDLIIRGGDKLFPEEIEEVLLQHPSVAEAAVVGMPDPVYEEVPVAFIAPAGEGALDVAALEAHCRARMAPFKVPRIFRAIAALPRNPNGKLQRRALTALLAEERGRSGT
jgi:long-chain acyl-CoA synthetase